MRLLSLCLLREFREFFRRREKMVLVTTLELNIAISAKRGLQESADWTADVNWPMLLRELPRVALIASNKEWTCGYDFRDKPSGFEWDGKACHSTPGEAVALCWLKWKEREGKSARQTR